MFEHFSWVLTDMYGTLKYTLTLNCLTLISPVSPVSTNSFFYCWSGQKLFRDSSSSYCMPFSIPLLYWSGTRRQAIFLHSFVFCANEHAVVELKAKGVNTILNTVLRIWVIVIPCAVSTSRWLSVKSAFLKLAHKKRKIIKWKLEANSHKTKCESLQNQRNTLTSNAKIKAALLSLLYEDWWNRARLAYCFLVEIFTAFHQTGPRLYSLYYSFFQPCWHCCWWGARHEIHIYSVHCRCEHTCTHINWWRQLLYDETLRRLRLCAREACINNEWDYLKPRSLC